MRNELVSENTNNLYILVRLNRIVNLEHVNSYCDEYVATFNDIPTLDYLNSVLEQRCYHQISNRGYDNLCNGTSMLYKFIKEVVL